MRPSTRLLIVLATMTLTCSAARAISLSGKSAADREGAAPLRAADLGAVLDGAPVNPAVLNALSKLPGRCRERSEKLADCDDDLRCAWLGARGALLRSWPAASESEREQAVAALVRVADRLAAGGTCGLTGEDLARWDADRSQSDLDAGRAALALAARVPDVDAGPVLGGGADREVRALIALARSSGVAPVDAGRLAGHRAALLRYAQRQRWIAAQPALGELRRVVLWAWSPVGGVPQGCGAELLRGELLEDQWRGYLVREVAPSALECLGRRLPAERARRGKPVADPVGAERLSRELGAIARADAGGRAFGVSAPVVDAMARLAAVLEPPAPAPPPLAGDVRVATAEPGRKGKRGRTATPAAAQSVDADVKPAAGPGAASASLAALAREVAAVTGDDPSALARDARAADSEMARLSVQRRLFVALHRAACRPLGERDPEDLDAARRALGRGGPDERVCRAEPEARALEALLAEAPGLARLAAVADLRGAARAAGAGQFAAARGLLERVPEPQRSPAWLLVSAWVERVAGDAARAASRLERIDRAQLDRFRAAGTEAARMVAQASGSSGR
ncbi:MAG: hypothetical protein MUC67_08060 [Acidobacteria bacterium]|nr:hypothetical protein [Acidobacteriota bacterium]